MGKRSPILGFNHNVRYRGLIFHVQTEDSGIATPHLFTHLFHTGVIVSTRKLVYDAGSAEESIKSLMQAQHKAVLKDLRRGHFDDKIDSYLGGTPGLLARGASDAVNDTSEMELPPSQGTVEDLAAGAPTEQVLPMADEASAPVVIVERPPPPSRPPTRSIPAAPTPAAPTPGTATPPPIPARPTSERPVAVPRRQTPASVDTTLRTAIPTFESEPDPEIEIQLEVDDDGDAATVVAQRRATRDTENQVPAQPSRPTLNDTRPSLGAAIEDARRSGAMSDGIPGSPRTQSAVIPAVDPRRLGDRPSTINAATLPPARPISRPPSRSALSQPPVVTRPVAASSDDRSRRESEAIEVYSPAPGSVELPPGERPGQYAQHHKISTRIPIEGLKNERSAGVPVPAGLGRPRAGSPTTTPPRSNANAVIAPSGVPAPAVPPPPGPPPVRPGQQTEPLRPRVPTPSRVAVPGSSVPTPSRVGSTGAGGVVMTRPAVIVGAPAKSPGTVPRIRKAREDEGRGFGQGLISEKSLDEVILAYLSEDADEK